MPPEKIIKLDPKQQTLFGLLSQQMVSDTDSKASQSETASDVHLYNESSQPEPTSLASSGDWLLVHSKQYQ